MVDTSQIRFGIHITYPWQGGGQRFILGSGWSIRPKFLVLFGCYCWRTICLDYVNNPKFTFLSLEQQSTFYLVVVMFCSISQILFGCFYVLFNIIVLANCNRIPLSDIFNISLNLFFYPGQIKVPTEYHYHNNGKIIIEGPNLYHQINIL